MTNHGIVTESDSPFVRAIGRYTDNLSPEYLSGPCLYFVRCSDGSCKIGKTASIKSRMHTLQNASPTKLRLEMYLPGMGWQERVWHAAFAEWRRSGEWFEWSIALANAIEAARVGDEWIATLPEEPAAPHRRRRREIIADREEDAKYRFLNAFWEENGEPELDDQDPPPTRPLCGSLGDEM